MPDGCSNAFRQFREEAGSEKAQDYRNRQDKEDLDQDIKERDVDTLDQLGRWSVEVSPEPEHKRRAHHRCHGRVAACSR